MSTNIKSTSSNEASLAVKILSDPKSSDIAKSLAASVLSQTHTDKQTGSEMEDIAARVLSSDKYNEDTKSLAASVLSQSNKER